MYRFLLTPRWWAINVFVVLAIPVCLVAGTWQLGRFEDQVDAHREAQRTVTATGPARPLAELLPVTAETAGDRATVTGTYDAERQLLVPNRLLDGRSGSYVLTMLRPADGGPAVPVVRGWLPGPADPDAAPEPPGGEVTVEGALQAAESPASVNAPTALPAGQLGVISAASLINVLPYPVLDGWLTVSDATAPLTAVPPTAPAGTGLDADAFQNLGYTAEWFVFAAFAVFMWFRLFRREVETRRDAALGLPVGEPEAAARPAAPAAPRDTAQRDATPENATPENATPADATPADDVSQPPEPAGAGARSESPSPPA